MKHNIIVSHELKDFFNFFDSLNVEYRLYLDPEGLSFYVDVKDIFVDLIICDYKYSFIATIDEFKFEGDDILASTLKSDSIFEKILEKTKK